MSTDVRLLLALCAGERLANRKKKRREEKKVVKFSDTV